jgi:hypothetical protein
VDPWRDVRCACPLDRERHRRRAAQPAPDLDTFLRLRRDPRCRARRHAPAPAGAGAVAGLVVELQPGATSIDFRDALGRALGDSSLELAYWLPSQSRYVDPDGLPVELPEGEAGRVATIAERDGEPVAALIHDAALCENAELADSVCAAAALTLENERLRTELLAKLAELQASQLVSSANE